MFQERVTGVTGTETGDKNPRCTCRSGDWLRRARGVDRQLREIGVLELRAVDELKILQKTFPSLPAIVVPHLETAIPVEGPDAHESLPLVAVRPFDQIIFAPKDS